MTNPALLAGVVAAPDDDVPRLVYADWLEENGQPDRADFIRVQCCLACLSPADDDYYPSLDCEADLAAWLDAHAPEAVPDLPQGVTFGVKGVAFADAFAFRRGFPHGVRVDTNVPPSRRSADWFATLLGTSTVRGFAMRDTNPLFADWFLGHPAVGRVDEVAVENHREADAFTYLFRRLADSPAAASLSRLRVAGADQAGAAAALAAGRFPRLRELTLGTSGYYWTDATAVLRRAAWFPQLDTLTLADPLSDANIAAFLSGPPLPRLRRLKLDEHAFDPTDYATLAGSAAFPNLTSLSLAHSWLTPIATAALAKANWPLAALDLHNC